MTWSTLLPKAPARDKEPWATKEQIWQEWESYVATKNRANTRRNLLMYVRVFLGMFEVLATNLERDDVQAFVNRISTKCSRLILADPPECRRKLAISACPVLLGIQPYTTCAQYEPLQPSGVWSYICAVNQFYEWMLTEGRIKVNPALPVMRAYAETHRDWFDERRRKPKRRNLQVQDVGALVHASPIHHAIAHILMAKCFLRIHEVLKLRLDPEYCNLEEGWMDIPTKTASGEVVGKRKGNKRIILDAELRRWMRAYLAWRSEKLAHLPDRTTTVLLITVFGKPWGKAAIQNFNKALQKNAIAAGLMTGKETKREERINSHAFRAFATTWAEERDIPARQLQILRGDLAPGAIERYDDYLRRLPELYRKYGPVLGL